MPKSAKSKSKPKSTARTARSIFGNRVLFLLLVAIFVLAVLNKWIAQERTGRATNPKQVIEKQIVRTPASRKEQPDEILNITDSEMLDTMTIKYNPEVFSVERGQQQAHFDLYTTHSFPALFLVDKASNKRVVTLVDFSAANKDIETLDKSISLPGGAEDTTDTRISVNGTQYQSTSEVFGEGGPRSENCWGGGGVTTNHLVTQEKLGVIIESSFTETGCTGEEKVVIKTPTDAVLLEAVQAVESIRL